MHARRLRSTRSCAGRGCRGARAVSRSGTIACAFAALGLLAAGCTILQPLSQSDSDRRFARPAGQSDSGATTASCVGADCEPAPVDIDAYHAGMGRAMWEVDMRRRELARKAMERSNLASAYNALTWPIGIFVVNKKLADPSWSARDAVALGLASYKLLGEGIPERDRVYLKTSNRLACTLIEAEARLYGPGATLRGESTGLQQLGLALRNDLISHDSAREQLLLQLEMTQRKIATTKPVDNIAALRLTAIGKSGGGSAAPSDPTNALRTATDDLQASAKKTLQAANELLGKLGDAASALRQERGRVESAMNEELSGRAPAVRDPLDTAQQIAKAFNDGLAAEADFASKARARAESGKQAPAAPWSPTPAQLRALTKSSADAVRGFWVGHQVVLRQQQAATQAWLDAHQARVREMAVQSAKLGCSTTDISQFVLDLAKRVGGGAGGANSADSGGSEQRLPAAPGGAAP